MGYSVISRENNFDVVRLFAALQVCIGHTFAHFNISGGGISEFLSNFPGVIIFFALSGFLITSSWCNSQSVKKYTKNRFLRIFPALFVCFVVLQITMIVLGHINLSSFRDKQMWLYWIGQLSLGQFFTPDALRNFGVGTPNGSLWTIPIEIEFYIILPLLFILLVKFDVKYKILILAAVSVVANVVFAYLPTSEGHSNAHNLINGNKLSLILILLKVTVLPYLYCFLLGSILFLCWEKIKRYFINKGLFWLGGYIILIYTFGTHPAYTISNGWQLISNLLLGCVAISCAFSFGRLYKFLCGIDISYGIYIVHMIVVNVFLEIGLGYTILHSIMAILITIILAILLYFCVEKPALKLKNVNLFTLKN